MVTDETRPRARRRTTVIVVAIGLAAIVAFALWRLGPHRIVHALVSANPGWLVLALALMALSLALRAVSWHETLRAALPATRIGWLAVLRATMIGVMTSAVFPGRLGEPTRVVVLSRRLQGPRARLIAIVSGTVFSQTLINLLALAILAAIAFSSVPLLHGHTSGLAAVLAVPLGLCLLLLSAPALLRLARRAPSLRVRAAAIAAARLLALARSGMAVFAKPRHGIGAVGAQLAAWALQWSACYVILLALGLQDHAAPAAAAAAAILLAVKASAVLPATPSNVGVFQAACLVVLAAYGVGAGPALAYGIILQAVEVLTALALGVPALLGEGMTWDEIRSAARTRKQERASD
jgi:phosphatidyl-myo-inositol alpha-mannosyltransferase